MKKRQFMGWGTVALGFAFLSAGLFEWSAGEFMPGGYRTDPHWLVSSVLVTLFREYGPYLSGLIWLFLAAVCFRAGVGLLHEAATWTEVPRLR